MQIDVHWLKEQNACSSGINRFRAWAEDQPQTLADIAENHDNAYDLAWLIDQVAPLDIRQGVACRIASQAAAEMRHRAGGERMLPYAWKITMDNVHDAAEAARAIGASALVDLCDDAARGAVAYVLYAFGSFTVEKDVPKWIENLLRHALHTVHNALM
jgi:hypothetical protein